MPSGEPSPPIRTFDPAAIPRFSVIRQPYRFSSDPPAGKLFVVLGHVKGHAVCLKTTSQTAFYSNNPQLLTGCVCYEANELHFFPKKTIIQLDNQIPIAHAAIRQAAAAGTFEVVGTLPADFPERLRKAAEASVLLSPNELRRLFQMLWPSR